MEAGAHLYSIVNIHGDEVEILAAPARGVFMRSNMLSTVSRGERAANPRAGFSDARFWRHAGVPSAVYGVGARHMGGVDEHATVEDMNTVFAVHAFAPRSTVSAAVEDVLTTVGERLRKGETADGSGGVADVAKIQPIVKWS